MAERPSCRTCRYAQIFGPQEDGSILNAPQGIDQIGECRRRAPTALHSTYSFFPILRVGDEKDGLLWCGEHRPFQDGPDAGPVADMLEENGMDEAAAFVHKEFGV